ncbi:PfkB family carbohydrate kinase [Streptomyces sp. PDY-4]|uniref:PfkB family carbohydrate kinase n=1 Tax=Streptomyces sp. PDY-4 TaxID=3376070 RepID=UPI0037BDE2D2
MIVALAGDGVLLLEGAAHPHVPAFSVRPWDTTAAGDSFRGALAVALAEDRILSGPPAGPAPPRRAAPFDLFPAGGRGPGARRRSAEPPSLPGPGRSGGGPADARKLRGTAPSPLPTLDAPQAPPRSGARRRDR